VTPYLGICTECGVLLVRRTDEPEPTNLGYHTCGPVGEGYLVRVVPVDYALDEKFASLAPELRR
jgi:hypothetical protein